MTKRTHKILELLSVEKRLEVTRLSELLGVSQVTMRKDLDELEQRGIILREHGYALLQNRDDINGRIAYHYEAKKRIAQRAAELVKDGDTLMIESGSCCALLAETLCELRHDLTILTNSAFIADHIRRKSSSIEVILLGGIYQQESQVLVGPMVRQCAENFCVDRFFIGTDGYSTRAGFTNCDQMRAQAVRDMAQQAEQVIVLTESEKFMKHGVVPLNITNHIQMVITDDRITSAMSEELQKQQIEVITTQSSH